MFVSQSIKVYDPLHLRNKVIMKEQLQPTSTNDLRISIMKPIYEHWILLAFYRVAKDIRHIAGITHGWRRAGLLTEYSVLC